MDRVSRGHSPTQHDHRIFAGDVVLFSEGNTGKGTKAMTTHRIAAEATLAWDAGNRKRRASAGLERCVDALMASGGLLVVNAVGSLNLGLPEGRAGLSLGGTLLAAAAAHLTHRRRSARAHASKPTYAPSYAQYGMGAPVRVRAASHHAA